MKKKSLCNLWKSHYAMLSSNEEVSIVHMLVLRVIHSFLPFILLSGYTSWRKTFSVVLENSSSMKAQTQCVGAASGKRTKRFGPALQEIACWWERYTSTCIYKGDEQARAVSARKAAGSGIPIASQYCLRVEEEVIPGLRKNRNVFVNICSFSVSLALFFLHCGRLSNAAVCGLSGVSPSLDKEILPFRLTRFFPWNLELEPSVSQETPGSASSCWWDSETPLLCSFCLDPGVYLLQA